MKNAILPICFISLLIIGMCFVINSHVDRQIQNSIETSRKTEQIQVVVSDETSEKTEQIQVIVSDEYSQWQEASEYLRSRVENSLGFLSRTMSEKFSIY